MGKRLFFMVERKRRKAKPELFRKLPLLFISAPDAEPSVPVRAGRQAARRRGSSGNNRRSGHGWRDNADFRAAGSCGSGRFPGFRTVNGGGSRNGADNQFLLFMGLVGALQGKVPPFSGFQGIIRLLALPGLLGQRLHTLLQLRGGVQLPGHPLRIPFRS